MKKGSISLSVFPKVKIFTHDDRFCFESIQNDLPDEILTAEAGKSFIEGIIAFNMLLTGRS